MLNAIAIDDEPIGLEIIKQHVAKVSFIDLKATFTNVFDGIEYLKKEQVDLLFLDIQMPDLSGVELVESLSKRPQIIFTTAHSEYAVKGFELDAIDYLLKPFNLVRFLKACQKAYDQYQLVQENKSNEEPFIFIKSGYEEIKIRLKEILYVEGLGNYVQYVLTNQKVTSRSTMKKTLEILPNKQFIRIHKSFIVASHHIDKITTTEIFVHKKAIPIGEGYRNNIDSLKA